MPGSSPALRHARRKLNVAGSVTHYTGVLNQKFVHEVSPQSGRKIVAHGVSRGAARPPSSPSPLPPGRERGAAGGVRVLFPGLAPWATIFRPPCGLNRTLPGPHELVNEFRGAGAERVARSCEQSALLRGSHCDPNKKPLKSSDEWRLLGLGTRFWGLGGGITN